MWHVEKSERKGFSTLDEALDEKAKCCGVSCCEKLLRLQDRVTRVTYSLFWENGALIQLNEETGVKTFITQPEDTES